MKYELKEGAEETKRKVNSTGLNDPISHELRQCSKNHHNSVKVPCQSTCCRRDEVPRLFYRAKAMGFTGQKNNVESKCFNTAKKSMDALSFTRRVKIILAVSVSQTTKLKRPLNRSCKTSAHARKKWREN